MAWPGYSLEQIWLARELWSRYGTTHSMEQTWHDTLHAADMAWPVRSLEQKRLARELYGADMLWPGNNMEQIWHDTLYRADMGRDTPWSRYSTTHPMEQTWHGTFHGADTTRHTP